MASGSSLPMQYVVLADPCICSQQPQLFDPCLCHQHAVKGIPVNPGQLTEFFGVGGFEGQQAKAAHQSGIMSIRWGLELAERSLDGYFRDGDARHENEVCAICYEAAMRFREARIVSEPPQQNVGVEQKPHGDSPYQSRSSSFVKSSKSAEIRTWPSQTPGTRSPEGTHLTSLTTG